MCEKGADLSHLLARVNYPMYGVRTLSERHILVAGGGGPAKTGIANTCEIYELIYDKQNNSCKARLITHYDTGSRAIMNLCVVDKSNHFYQLFCGGMDGMCTVYDVKLVIESKKRESSSSPIRRERTLSETSLRRRRTSSTSGANDKENDINIEKIESEVQNRKNSKPTINTNDDQNGVPDFVFEMKQKKIFQTDFSEDEPFQKIVKYSSEANVLITGGSDGHIRVWSYPKLEQIYSIKAHDNEIDDLDINPVGTQIVSVSRDGNGFIWDSTDGKLKSKLKYEIPNVNQNQNNNQNNNNKNGMTKNNKYIYRGSRFGAVEGDLNNFKLYTIMNPLVRTNPPQNTYICKWNTHNYIPEKIVNSGQDSLSTMAISDNGRFLGLGTLTGSVDVYIAFSLQRVYHISHAHNIFVTGVEFLKSSEETEQLTGGNDAALVSVSVDNHIVLHQIPKRAMLGFLGSTTFFIVFMLIIYIFMNYLGL